METFHDYCHLFPKLHLQIPSIHMSSNRGLHHSSKGWQGSLPGRLDIWRSFMIHKEKEPLPWILQRWAFHHSRGPLSERSLPPPPWTQQEWLSTKFSSIPLSGCLLICVLCIYYLSKDKGRGREMYQDLYYFVVSYLVVGTPLEFSTLSHSWKHDNIGKIVNIPDICRGRHGHIRVNCFYRFNAKN